MLAKKFRLQLQNYTPDKKNSALKLLHSSKSVFFSVKIFINHLNYSRFGLVISLKVSPSAVQRNKIKRIIFNNLRLSGEYLKPGRDIVIIVLPATNKLSKEELEKEIKKILRDKN